MIYPEDSVIHLSNNAGQDPKEKTNLTSPFLLNVDDHNHHRLGISIHNPIYILPSLFHEVISGAGKIFPACLAITRKAAKT